MNQNISLLLAACGLLCAALFVPEAHAAKRANARYFQYFPSNSTFVAIVGPLSKLQNQSKRLLAQLKKKSPLGTVIESSLTEINQKLGINLLSSASLRTKGLYPKTQLWLAGPPQNKDNVLGLLAPCNGALVGSLIRKASKKAKVVKGKMKNYDVTTYYQRKKTGLPNVKGKVMGLSMISKGKAVFFLAWEAAHRNRTAQQAIKEAMAQFALNFKPRSNLSSSTSFKAALTKGSANSSAFVYVSPQLLNKNGARQFRRFSSGMIRNVPLAPFRNTIRRRLATNAQLKWALGELKIKQKAVDFRMYVEVGRQNAEYKLVKKMFRVATRPVSQLLQAIGARSLLTSKAVFNAYGAFKMYVKELRSKPSKRKELKQFQKGMQRFRNKTGLRLGKDVLALFSGHGAFGLYGFSPQILKQFRIPKNQRNLGAMVQLALILGLTDGAKAKRVLTRLEPVFRKELKKKFKINTFRKMKIYEFKLERSLSLYWGVHQKQLIFAPNLKTFAQIQKQKKRGSATSVRLIRRGINARHGGLLYIDAPAIRRALGALKLTFGQRMVLANVMQFTAGLQGIYSAYTIRPTGLGFGFGLRLQ